jgi:hypothetical protein
MNRRTIALSLLATVLLAGCGVIPNKSWDRSHGLGDGPVGTIDGTHAYIVEFPNGFMNLAFKCHGTDGLYVNTKSATPVVVPNDANCQG